MERLTVRPRRLRENPRLRALVRETVLTPSDFIAPLFAVPGRGVRQDLLSLPGVARLSVDLLPAAAKEVADAGVPAVLLFGVPESKDERGSGAFAPDGIVQRAIAGIKEAVPDLVVITDVCLCAYTTHGHCGLVDGPHIVNDPSVEVLAHVAVSHARAGADVVAPSDMMDGRVAGLRRALDAEGFVHTPILSYAAKYASGFYGPFREAQESAPAFGDRATYQMDPANAEEALREVALDLEEGADIVMVKPALPYLDVIRRVKERFGVPVAAFQVSGEYCQIKAAGHLGWIDERRIMMETLTAIRRAGADMIITYFSVAAARLLVG